MTTYPTTYTEVEARAKAARIAAVTEARIAVADAETDRKIRAAAAEADLKARQIANTTAKREAKTAAKTAEATRKTEARSARREARTARRQAAIARVSAYVAGNMPGVYSAGIYAMALYVAVSGQIGVATDRGWPVVIGIGMAAFLEGTALAMALTAHQQRLKGERALTPRVMTWVAAGFAAAINFGAHTDDLVMAAVLGASSLAAIVVWEVRSGAKHRDALRKLGLIPEPGVRFGMRRWLRYFPSTFAAWSLDVKSRVGADAAALLATVEADRAAAKARAEAVKAAAEADRKATRAAKAADRTAKRDTVKLAKDTAKAKKSKQTGTDSPEAAAPAPAKPRRSARTGTPTPDRTSKARKATDAELTARLAEVERDTDGTVPVRRAARELGTGPTRAKRLLRAAGLLTAPADAPAATPATD